MNANQEKEIIAEKLNILHSEVYQQMMNEEKNKYDPEIKLPFNKLVHIELKKKYNLANRNDDTIKKQKRRENSAKITFLSAFQFIHVTNGKTDNHIER